jgi:lysozyme family protein
MADLKKSIAVLFNDEGGLANFKEDHGGVTKYGISLTFLKNQGVDINHDGKVDGIDIISLTKDEAAALFITYFGEPSNAGKFKSQKMCDKLFDMAINMGVHQAVVIFQRALISLGCALTEDGANGGMTQAAVNSMTDAGNEKSLLLRVREFQRAFYVHIIQNNPTQVAFYQGWMNRVDAV